MIKGLKKLFIGLLIGLPISFVNVSDSTWSAHTIGAYFGSEYQVSVINKGDVNTINGDSNKFVFAPRSDLVFYWDGDSNPMLLMPNCYQYRYGGQLVYYYECDEIPDSNFTSMTNCGSPSGIDTNYLASFLSSINGSDNWAFDYIQGLNLKYGFDLCFSSKEYGKSLCFGLVSSNYNDWCNLFQRDFTQLYGYQQDVSPFSGGYYTDLTYTFDTIPSDIIGRSPGAGGGSQNIPIPSGTGLNDYVYIEIGTGDIIDYFEKEKGYNPAMCFVGTTDLTSNYEDRVVYHEGTGYTIFDTYSKLFNVNYMTLNEVGTFVNNRHLNYLNWFVNGGNINPESVPYNAIYNGPNDSYFDYGSGLSSPFLGNKAVYFFIGGYFGADTYQKDGQELLYYCYKFLGSQDKISNDGSNYNITDDHSSTYDENVAVYTRNKRAETTYYTGSREIVGQNRDGTPLDYFTGDDMSISSFSDFFSDSFNKLKVSRGDINYGDLGLGYIPNYIIFFLLAIIFFRFLSH